MSIDPKLLLSNFPVIMASLSLLIGGKTLLVSLVGRMFGVSSIAANRTGLLLAPGGEFAFVAFGDAVNQGIMAPQLSSLLFLVVGISMAITPWLAAGGQFLASKFEQNDVRSLLPIESELPSSSQPSKRYSVGNENDVHELQKTIEEMQIRLETERAERFIIEAESQKLEEKQAMIEQHLKTDRETFHSELAKVMQMVQGHVHPSPSPFS